MAEEADEREGEAASEEESAKKSKPARKMDTLIVVIIGVLVIVLTPLLTFVAVKKAAPEQEAETPKPAKVSGDKFMLELRPINVNIHGTKGTRFLRLEVALVLSEERLMSELSASTPLLTDRVILAASRRTIDELEGPQGREALKRDIISEINAAIKGKMAGAVVDIYFKEFLIQ